MLIQKTIINGISELLYTHDYVVVPGFGGFVSRARHSHLSVSGEVLFPPSKSIVFNVQLKQNDGVLANWLMEKANCSFSEAVKHIEEFSLHCKMLLETKRRLEFENFGLFYLNFEKNVCFEPKADVNFLIESFGLSSVTLKELEKEIATVIEEKPLIETKDRFVRAETTEKLPVKKRNYKKIAAIAIAVPVIGFALLFAAKSIKPHSNSFAGIFGSSEGAYNPVTYSTDFSTPEVKTGSSYVVDANGYSSINLFENKTVVVNVSAVTTGSITAISNKLNSVRISGRFQVVMGCFSIEQNARKLIKKLRTKNINASISGTNAKGMFVVSCGGFDNKDSAVNMLQTVKDQHPNAWVMTQN